MTKKESKKIKLGLYVIYWKEGGRSIAAVGILHNGERWFAPVNWTAQNTTGIVSKNWKIINKVIPMLHENAF